VKAHIGEMIRGTGMIELLNRIYVSIDLLEIYLELYNIHTLINCNQGSVRKNGSSISPVKAFMNVDRDRVSILKNGSRTGYLVEPHSDKCSRICGMPVLSRGVVRSETLTAHQQPLSINHSM